MESNRTDQGPYAWLPLRSMMHNHVGRMHCTWTLLLLLIAPACLKAQVQPASGQTPKSTQATEQILSSYEGQNVTAIEIAGRPESNPSDFKSLFLQQPGQPYSSDKVIQTVAALKATGKFDDVRVQVDPEANGIRVLLILEPAVYFGIFEFPGAGRFSYSRLALPNHPIATPFKLLPDVEKDRQTLLHSFDSKVSSRPR